MTDSQEEKKPEKDEKTSKSMDDMLQNVPDGEKRDTARQWLTTQEGYASQWDQVQKDGHFDPGTMKEAPRTEFHSIGALSNVTAHLDQITIFNQARDLAAKQGHPDLMDTYVRLILASEMMQRFKDGSLVLMGIHPTQGPIIASTFSDTFKKKQAQNKKEKNPESGDSK